MLPRHLDGLTAAQLVDYYNELHADIQRCNYQFRRMIDVNPRYAIDHERAHNYTISVWRQELRSIDEEL